MNGQSVKEFFEDIEHSIEYKIEEAKLDFALELKRFMDQNSIKNVELAERLGVSKPMVSKLLRGDANATIETMVRACDALGGTYFVKILRQSCSARLFEVVKADAGRPNEKLKRALIDTHYSNFKHKWSSIASTQSTKPINEPQSATA